GTHLIQVLSSLPVITNTVVINGFSEANPNIQLISGGTPTFIPSIVLDGRFAGGAGLVLLAPNNQILGLAFVNFLQEGIAVQSNGNTISGNFLGLDGNGTPSLGIQSLGINILNADNNMIGGTTASVLSPNNTPVTVRAGNVISGNKGDGIDVAGN